jgi:hypothetical protein
LQVPQIFKMIQRKLLLGFGFLTIGTGLLFSQSIVAPNYALKSHETLEIKKIETTIKATVFYMSIENRIDNGTFCADKNIFIIYPDGTKNKISYSSGIPVCPDSYKFKKSGEKLDFVLTFPPLKPGTECIDLIEDCSDNCFSFYGITLNQYLNKKINDAIALVENDQPAQALTKFINLAEETDNKNYGIEGLLYMSIIRLAKDAGNTTRAAEWYNKLKISGAPGVSQYLKYLNDQGIKY